MIKLMPNKNNKEKFKQSQISEQKYISRFYFWEELVKSRVSLFPFFRVDEWWSENVVGSEKLGERDSVCVCVWVCVCVKVWKCEWVQERESEWVSECVCVCVCVSVWVSARETERERDSVCVCMCVCVEVWKYVSECEEKEEESVCEMLLTYYCFYLGKRIDE